MNLLNLRLLILRNLYLLFMLLNRFNCLIMLSNLLNSLNNWFILLLKYLRFLQKFIKFLILLIIPHYKLQFLLVFMIYFKSICYDVICLFRNQVHFFNLFYFIIRLSSSYIVLDRSGDNSLVGISLKRNFLNY